MFLLLILNYFLDLHRPTIRFGVGFIMAFVAALTLFFNEPRVKNKMFTYAVLICLVSNLILLNKITNYFNFLDNPVLLIEKMQNN